MHFYIIAIIWSKIIIILIPFIIMLAIYYCFAQKDFNTTYRKGPSLLLKSYLLNPLVIFSILFNRSHFFSPTFRVLFVHVLYIDIKQVNSN